MIKFKLWEKKCIELEIEAHTTSTHLRKVFP